MPDNISSPVIIKPKGMHQNTFNKLKLQQGYYINNSMQEMSQKLSLLLN